MRRLFVLSLMTVILIITIAVSKAEPASHEIIFLKSENPAVWSFWRYGNIYAYTPGGTTPTRLTTSGFITAPALSPDGTMLAYAATAAWAVSAAANGNYIFDVDRDDPMDIWIMDIASREFTQITDPQPAGTTIYRSKPIWSPDNQRIAWFMWNGESQGGRVAVYDRRTGEETILASGLLMNMGDAGMFNLSNLIGWGSQIAHTVVRVNEDKPTMLLETISDDGSVMQQNIGHTDYFYRILWVWYGESWWVATQNMDDHWQFVRPDTGEQIEAINPPILQRPDGKGARLRPVSTGWEILHTGGNPVPIPYDGKAFISPDGKSVVYMNESTPYIWNDAHGILPLFTGEQADWTIISLVWSPMVWVSTE